MPLSRGYSVLIGTVANHYIDPPDHLGRWHITILKSRQIAAHYMIPQLTSNQ